MLSRSSKHRKMRHLSSNCHPAPDDNRADVSDADSGSPSYWSDFGCHATSATTAPTSTSDASADASDA
jgi:hypothetical protein